MITDMQLGVMANILGIGMFILVILFHYIQVNYVSKAAQPVTKKNN
jgi:hypothetical protein